MSTGESDQAPSTGPGVKLVAELRGALDDNALTTDDFAQALGAHLEACSLSETDRLQVVAAASLIFGTAPPRKSDLRALRLLAAEVAELLDVTFSREALDEVVPLSRKFWRPISNVIGALLLAFVAYLVIGNLLAGKSGLVKNPLTALVLFCLLLLLLGTVEALHISVVALRMTNLDDSRRKYSRTFRLHQIFHSEDGTRRFLAGRQFLVITTVFAMAQLTTFPHSDRWPGTTVSIPSWLQPIAVTMFLRFGIGGAMFVLWFAQLTPQFVANRIPRRFMNIRAVGLLFRIALVAEALGITRPADWLSLGIAEEPESTGSAKERFKQAVYQVQGMGTATVSKSWIIRPGRSVVNYRSTATIVAATIPKVIDRGFLVRMDNVSRVQWESSYITRAGQPDRGLDLEPTIERFDNWHMFKEALTPRFGGTFMPGGVLVNEATLSGVSAGEDGFYIDSPTKLLLFRATFVGAQRMSDVMLSTYRAANAIDGVGGNDLTLVDEQKLETFWDAENQPFVSHTILYPPLNSYYRIQWSVEY